MVTASPLADWKVTGAPEDDWKWKCEDHSVTKKNHLDSEGRSDLLLDTRALRFQGFLEAFLDRDTGRKLLQQLQQKSR